MNYEPNKEFKQLEMTIDNEKMLISITTETIIRDENRSPRFNNQEVYTYSVGTPVIDKPIGDLLFSFINADFKTQSGFQSFISIWGLSGLLEVNTKCNNPIFNYVAYDNAEAEELFISFYNLTKLTLIEAQNNFKKVIDFCINADTKPYLEGLSPLQRYYAGNLKKIIPDLYIYSTPHYVSYNAIRHFPDWSSSKEMFAEYDYSIEELCNSIKADTFNLKTTYTSRNIINFVYIEFFNLLSNFSISKCNNCNNYFVPKSKITEIYCKNCRHTGYINKIKNNEFLKLYNTSYKTKHAQKQRKTYGKSDEINEKYDIALKKWREESKLKLSLVKKGEISQDDYKDFLNSNLEV